MLRAHLQGLLADTPWQAQARTVAAQALERSLVLAQQVADASGGASDAAARQAASALYHASTAIAMAWEAGRTASARRMRMAQLVIRHRLLSQDPLAIDADADPAWLPALLEPGAVAEPPSAVDLLSAAG